MLITVTSNNLLLAGSGVFNQVINHGSDNNLIFNFDGLMVNLKTSAVGIHEIYNHPINAYIDNGTVVLNQPYRLPDNSYSPGMKQGMLVPYEIGMKPDGKKMFISWMSQAQKAENGIVVLTTTYSLYVEL